jgi:nucleoid-associated protein YgaU
MDDQRALSSGASSPQINDPDRIFPGQVINIQ